MCDNTAADFRAAWRRVFNIFKSEGATNVKFLWSVSNASCKGRRCNPYRSAYPGNAYVHYVGFSAFNWGRHSGHRWQSMPSLVGNVMGYFRQFTRKPVIIAELATNKTRRQQAGLDPRRLQPGLQALAADQGHRLPERGPELPRSSGLEPRDPVRRLPGLRERRLQGEVQGSALIPAARAATRMDRNDRTGYGERVMPDAVVSLAHRSQVLDQMVRDEVTGGAHVAHRDSASAVLVRGSQRALVTVDEAGTVRVDRLVSPRSRRLAFLLLIALAVAAFDLAIRLGSILTSQG